MSHPSRLEQGSGLAMAFHPTLLTASLGLNLLGTALPIFTLQVYDRIIPNQALETLSVLVGMMVAVLVGEGLLRSARTVIAGWAGSRFEHRLGCWGVERLLQADQAALGRETAGAHLERLAAVDRLREFYANQGSTIVVDLPFAAIFLGLVWLIGGELALVTVVVFVAFALVALTVGSRLHKAIEARADSDDRRISFVIEVLTGITTVKALTMERQIMRRYERLMDGAASAAHDVTFLSGASQSLGGLFSNLAIVAVVSYGSLMVLDGEITTGQLVASSLLAGRVMQPLLRAMGIWTHFQSIRVAKERIDHLARMAQEPASTPDRAGPVRAGGVGLRDVHFAYDPARPLLVGASLDIRPGETVAIVAANGSGRSTALSIIAGLLRPQKGSVLYDGTPLGPKDPRPGVGSISWLPRQGTVFSGSLIDNLTSFRGGVSVDIALELAARLGLDRYVASLPQGYETEIGGGQTETLPGGVRQSIAIIRALVDAPKILLFDEGNNNLDRDTNERLLKLLADLKGKTTIVLATYQPSVLRLADRVVELREGRFVERPVVVPPPLPSGAKS